MIRQSLRSLLLGAALGVLAVGSAYAQGGGGELVIVANQEIQSMQAQVTYKESVKTAKKLKKKSFKARTQPEMPSRSEEYEVDTDEVGHHYLAEDIARSLKNNWDIKKAIVINEILTRKYN